MLKETMIAMALIGCDCDAKICEYIDSTPTQWTSLASCEAALKQRIAEGHDIYPLVIAVCRNADETPTSTAGMIANAEAATVVAPVLADAGGARVTIDRGGRATALFETLSGYVSVRQTVGGTLSSASRQALEAMSWLRDQAIRLGPTPN